MIQSKYYIYIYSEGFPEIISARNNKNALIAKSLFPFGFRSFFYSKRYYKTNVDSGTNLGNHDNVSYRFLNNSPKKINWINALFKEFFFLYNDSREYEKRYLILSYLSFPIFSLYYIFSLIFKFEIIISMMEWHIAVSKKSNYLHRLNSFLFDKIATRIIKKVMPISNAIAKEMFLFKKQEDILLLPVLTDYESISKIKPQNTFSDYFLYCGNIGYADVINFILDSYSHFLQKCSQNIDIELHLVIHGDKNEIKGLEKKCRSNPVLQQVKFFSELSYTELIQKYKSARALLIPLRETVQDQSRFPHKIAEYLASGRPIITNNWGEVSFYLKNKENALVAEKYNVELYSKLMSFSIANKIEIDEMGVQGRLLCKEKFDYINYGDKLSSFILG